MLPVAGWATLTGLFPSAQGFEVTPKVLQGGWTRSVSLPVLVCSTLGAGLAVQGVLGDHPLLAFAGILLLLPLAGCDDTGCLWPGGTRTDGPVPRLCQDPVELDSLLAGFRIGMPRRGCCS
jgi:hypothetical protein